MDTATDGGGRRSLGTNTQRGDTPQRCVRIHDELWAAITVAARANGCSTSAWIRDAVTAQLIVEGRPVQLDPCKPATR